MNRLTTMVFILFAQAALAGFISVEGTASGVFEFGTPNADLERELERAADFDAKEQCRRWSGQISRSSVYRVQRQIIPYWGYRVTVRADYYCGESDY